MLFHKYIKLKNKYFTELEPINTEIKLLNDRKFILENIINRKEYEIGRYENNLKFFDSPLAREEKREIFSNNIDLDEDRFINNLDKNQEALLTKLKDFNKYHNRTIELMVENEYMEKNEEVVEVPLLGKITAGNPIEAIENPDEYFSLPAYLIPKSKEVFTLINAGILDGDIVIVERRNTARNGEIVVAMTEENEVTLKTFYKEKNHIRLQPENDSMEPFIFDNVYILGKAIGLYRKL